MIFGNGTGNGTARFRSRFRALADSGHFRQPEGVLHLSNLWLSSVGIGTYLGEPDAATDERYAEAVLSALSAGVNVLDSAINYRFQRSERSIGTALRQAIVKDPFLRVLVMEGYYDLATPFAAADYTMDHLDLTPQYRKNISFAQYESGHMVYLDSQSHAKLRQDFANFIDATTKR